MDTERGTILRIDARGRVTVQLRDRVVFAELHSGGGGCVGDIVEGRMLAGVHSWRNVGTNTLCVVHVISPESDHRDPRDTRPGIPQRAFRID